MKKRELQELKKKPIEALQKELRAEQERLSNLRFDLSLGKVKNVREVRAVKKRIAQIETLLKEKENK